MNKKILILLVLAVFLLATICVTGLSETDAEKYSREFGNKSTTATITSTYAQTASMTYYQLFRTSSAITVNKIGIRTGTSSSFAGKPLLFGIMNVDSDGFITTWCGATNDAKCSWEPTASAWNEVTLNEVASLSDNTMYALVFQDNGGYLSGTQRFYHLVRTVPTAGFETVRGPDATIESQDCYVTKTVGGVYSFLYSLTGWFIRKDRKSVV